jgi:predicted small lipoprotein YifL
MKKTISDYLLAALFLSLMGCGTDSGPSDYTVSTSVSPAESGTVNPSTREVEEGTSITLEAISNQGWEFQEWTGSIISSENPLNYTVEEDVNVTANFRDITSEYSVEMTLSDGIDEIKLEFGQHPNATDISSRVPPSPPVGSLHAYFENNNKTWWKDYREDYQTSITWNLRYQMGESDGITLNWSIDASKLEGTLVLESQDGSIEVDMKQESSIDLSGELSEPLQIQYNLKDN